MAVGDPAPAVPRFEFATATRIIFGAGTSGELPAIAAALGRRVIVVTGAQPRRFGNLIDALAKTVDVIETLAITGEPTVDEADRGAAAAVASRVDVVVAIGGGSAIDAGKAIAALAANPGGALEFLEIVGRGQPLAKPSLPFIAVPTTAGTGAEVTRNAVLAVPASRVKASLRSAHMLPRVALVDPSLTLDLPPGPTATTGMDALTQLIEPFLSCRANPLSDALCVDGIRRAARALPVVFREPQNAAARSDMSLAALHGGLALANAGLGAVHGFAAPIGGFFPAPHGAICATLLPHVLRANLAALRARAPQNLALPRFDEIARLLAGRDSARADDAVAWCAELARDLKIPSLSSWGVRAEHIPELAEKAAGASSMKANPLPLTRAELIAILEAALAG